VLVGRRRQGGGSGWGTWQLQVVIHTQTLEYPSSPLPRSLPPPRLCISSHLHDLESKRKQIDTLTASFKAR
jgi:hypothetical protein